MLQEMDKRLPPSWDTALPHLPDRRCAGQPAGGLGGTSGGTEDGDREEREGEGASSTMYSTA